MEGQFVAAEFPSGWENSIGVAEALMPHIKKKTEPYA